MGIRRLTVLLAAGALVGVGACAESPTGTQAPAGPSFDGGHVFGSGARQEGDSTTTTTVTSEETTASDTTGTARGGHVFGSGA